MQRLPNPVMCPTSQSSGGEMHDNSAAMGPPGSQPVSPSPVGLVETLPLPVDSTPDRNDRRLVGTGGALHEPADVPAAGRDEAGRYTDANDFGWSSPGSDGGGWHQI